jgi:hypothetical protein
MRLAAQSISRSLQTGPLAEGNSGWRVLAVFERVCNLATASERGPSDHGRSVIVLVLPEVGDGPLNIVVGGQPGIFATAEPGAPARLAQARLYIGEVEIALAGASTWEPCPDWANLRPKLKQIQSRLPSLQTLARQHAPAGSLLTLLSTNPDLADFGTSARSGIITILEAARYLKLGWSGNSDLASRGASHLAGLGGGLTPAGDDFLMGAMLRAWLAHPEPEAFCHQLAEAAVPRTTTLSAALLRAAARGECSAKWHHLLNMLESGNDDQLAAAVQWALAYGHTSGADTLAGFLWLSSCIL